MITYHPNHKHFRLFECTGSQLSTRHLIGNDQQLKLWSHQDLNLEPTDYESVALTNCAIKPWAIKKNLPRKQFTIQPKTCKTH